MPQANKKDKLVVNLRTIARILNALAEQVEGGNTLFDACREQFCLNTLKAADNMAQLITDIEEYDPSLAALLHRMVGEGA